MGTCGSVWCHYTGGIRVLSGVSGGTNQDGTRVAGVLGRGSRYPLPGWGRVYGVDGEASGTWT